MRSHRNSGFTLIEILIVVIILGILAAIVIPQFTNASQDAKTSSLKSQLQTVKTQIELYKLQHGDQLPNLGTNWEALTKRTKADGTVAPVGGTALDYPFGPYLPKDPTNPVTNSVSVVEGTSATAAVLSAGYVYDYSSGSGTGKLMAVTKKPDNTATAID